MCNRNLSQETLGLLAPTFWLYPSLVTYCPWASCSFICFEEWACVLLLILPIFSKFPMFLIISTFSSISIGNMSQTSAETSKTHFPFTVESPLTIHPQPLSLSSFVFLANGVRLPLLGYGTTHQGGFSHAAFDAAIQDVGICLIDTARRYGTERLIGSALKKSGLCRNKFFITTKVWPSDYG